MNWLGSFFLKPSEPEEPPPEARGAKKRRLGRAVRLPRISGKGSALILLLCFVGSALLVPMTLRLPFWLEAEIVLGIWWLVWTITLARLLYTRALVASDFSTPKPRWWFGKNSGESKQPDWWEFLSFPDGGGDSLIGCLVVLAILILAPLLLWFFVEVAIPIVAFLKYLLIRGMLAHVINDRHSCKGNLWRSLGWDAVWATVYTVPLMLAVWGINWLVTARAGEL